MEFDPHDITYLLHGTDRQREAFFCLRDLAVLRRLSSYTPLLVSSVCLNIDTPSSDLDIICEVHDVESFEREARTFFELFDRFNVRASSTEPGAIVIQFFTPTFEIEIYGEAKPVTSQNGFRHFIQIKRAVDIGGEAFRRKLQSLKMAGMKSEPAMAQLLGLSGDPYTAVLDLEALADRDLAAKISAASASQCD